MKRRSLSTEQSALRRLDRLRGSIPRGPVSLSPEYLHLVRACEALPENRSGSDKTWVEDCLRAFREHYARSRRVR